MKVRDSGLVKRPRFVPAVAKRKSVFKVALSSSDTGTTEASTSSSFSAFIEKQPCRMSLVTADGTRKDLPAKNDDLFVEKLGQRQNGTHFRRSPAREMCVCERVSG
mmetsp:Transcript_28533/g.46246  ORF Transcript_28533/g.46246 Transcript_28533/m.46246 type:complete len:106 (-) Transcript_28533:161-478(-)